ncbi:hypothetical protein [Hyalangium sp.]|uniref:hypothetical protein n=1 Tax=Hyalangium sp. TaxID=2028555 RepID=UPI002D3C5310|nr:hypothetical protein [Hyalangium sp.]HYI01277.1 hypothetical protein [Hyalangium sp.]
MHTLKHLMGLLDESELTAMGRPPNFPSRYREQMTGWNRAQQKRRLRGEPSSQPQAWPGTPAPAPGRAGPQGAREESSAPLTGRQ